MIVFFCCCCYFPSFRKFWFWWWWWCDKLWTTKQKVIWRKRRNTRKKNQSVILSVVSFCQWQLLKLSRENWKIEKNKHFLMDIEMIIIWSIRIFHDEKVDDAWQIDWLIFSDYLLNWSMTNCRFIVGFVLKFFNFSFFSKKKKWVTFFMNKNLSRK